MSTKRVENILFLARFAPINDTDTPKYDDIWGNSPLYHHRLYHALKRTGPAITASRDPLDVVNLRHQTDFVYSIFNRAKFRNSEIFVSSLCAYMDVPYLGAHPNTRAIVEDKHLCKLVARRLDIPTPNWMKIDHWDQPNGLERLTLPCIVKWRFGADSVDITPNSIAYTYQELLVKVKEAQSEHKPIIVEEYVKGTNLTIGALGDDECRIFQTVEIQTNCVGNIQTYQQKKFGEGSRTKTIFHDHAINRQIRSHILRFFLELRPIDYFRCDFRYDPSSRFLAFLEINPICNLHPNSTYALSASNEIPEYDDLVKAILNVSLHRQHLVIE